MKILKNLLTVFLAVIIFSCQPPVESAPEIDLTTYKLNLETAQKLFATFSSEDIDSQKPLLCPGLTHYSPFYGSEPSNVDGFLAANKAWMDNFDEITYTDSKWFPGTDQSGKPDGSVMTMGKWTAKNTMTGNVINIGAFHTFIFNKKNQIHETRDFFDASGVMAAAMKTE